MNNNYSDWALAMMESWKNLEGGATAKLFSTDVEYYESLDMPPCRNFDDVVKLWEVVPENQSNISYSYSVIAEGPDCGIIHWTMTRDFCTPVEKITQFIDGIFQIKLNEQGKCNYFKQWRFTKVVK